MLSLLSHLFLGWCPWFVSISHLNSFLKHLEELSSTSGSLFFSCHCSSWIVGKVEERGAFSGYLEMQGSASWRICTGGNFLSEMLRGYWVKEKVYVRWDEQSVWDAKINVIWMAVLEVFLFLPSWKGGSQILMHKCLKCALLNMLLYGSHSQMSEGHWRY